MRRFNRPFSFDYRDMKKLARDVKEALQRLVDDIDKAEQNRPLSYVVGPVDILSSPASLVLVPRVPGDGMKLGRITQVVVSDLAQSSTDYWTMYLSYYRTVAGVRRRQVLDEWSTADAGFVAYEPVEHTLDEVLFEGDVVVLDVESAGTPGPLDGLVVQTSEMFGD